MQAQADVFKVLARGEVHVASALPECGLTVAQAQRSSLPPLAWRWKRIGKTNQISAVSE